MNLRSVLLDLLQIPLQFLGDKVERDFVNELIALIGKVVDIAYRVQHFAACEFVYPSCILSKPEIVYEWNSAAVPAQYILALYTYCKRTESTGFLDFPECVR